MRDLQKRFFALPIRALSKTNAVLAQHEEAFFEKCELSLWITGP